MLYSTSLNSVEITIYSTRHKNGDVSVLTKQMCSAPFTVTFLFCMCKRLINTLGMSYRRVIQFVHCRLESILPHFAGTLCCCRFPILIVFCDRRSTGSRFCYWRSIDLVPLIDFNRLQTSKYYSFRLSWTLQSVCSN